MKSYFLISAFCGLVSGVIFVFTPLSSIALVLFIKYFSILPLLYSALGLGLVPTLLGTALGTLIALIFSNLNSTFYYVIVFCVPALFIARFGLLSRNLDNQQKEWYPIGNILSILIIFSSLIFLVLSITLLMHNPNLLDLFENIVKNYFIYSYGDSPYLLNELSQIENDFPNIYRIVAAMTPALLVFSWIIMVIINACFAQFLLFINKKNIRPSPKYSEIYLPNYQIIILLVAVLITFLGENASFIGKTLTTINSVPFFVTGLALLHFITKQWSMRLMTMMAIYFMLIVTMPLSLIVVTIIGIFDHLFSYKLKKIKT